MTTLPPAASRGVARDRACTYPCAYTATSNCTKPAQTALVQFGLPQINACVHAFPLRCPSQCVASSYQVPILLQDCGYSMLAWAVYTLARA